MARMDEKQRRRRFRFGLISLFALVATVGILASLWNPFRRYPSRSNLHLVKTGMTASEVVELVGEPDTFLADSGLWIHAYKTDRRGVWLIGFRDDKVAMSSQIRQGPVAPP